MRFAAGSAPVKLLLIGAILLTPSAHALADAATNDDPATLSQPPPRQILLSTDLPHGEETMLERFRFTTKRGVEYRQTLSFGSHNVRLRFHGPIVKKKPGLGFKIEGLRIGSHPVMVKGFGNTKKQRLTVRVDF